MRDADELIKRILLFDGHPNLQRLNAITVGETAEEMLRLALDSEKEAVRQFNANVVRSLTEQYADYGALVAIASRPAKRLRLFQWIATK